MAVQVAELPKEQQSKDQKSFMERMLDGVERVGNKVPHPAIIFVVLILLVIALSHVMYLMGVSVTFEQVNPDAHKIEKTTAAAKSLLTADGIRFMYADVVKNF